MLGIFGQPRSKNAKTPLTRASTKGKKTKSPPISPKAQLRKSLQTGRYLLSQGIKPRSALDAYLLEMEMRKAQYVAQLAEKRNEINGFLSKSPDPALTQQLLTLLNQVNKMERTGLKQLDHEAKQARLGLRSNQNLMEDVLAELAVFTPETAAAIPSFWEEMKDLPKPKTVLIPGETVQWLQDHSLLAPVDPKSVCQGCYLDPVLLQRFFAEKCSTCQNAHAELIPGSIIAYLSGVRKLRNQVVVENASAINGALTGLLYSLPLASSEEESLKLAAHRVFVLTSGYVLSKKDAHANALFLYIDVPERKIQIRLYDPHVDTSYLGDKSTAKTKELLSKWVPAYIHTLLPQFSVQWDAGESCPIGLQANEYVSYATDTTQRKEMERLNALSTEVDALEVKYIQAQTMYAKHMVNYERVLAQLSPAEMANPAVLQQLRLDYMDEPSSEFQKISSLYEMKKEQLDEEMEKYENLADAERKRTKRAEHEQRKTKDAALQLRIDKLQTQAAMIRRQIAAVEPVVLDLINKTKEAKKNNKVGEALLLNNQKAIQQLELDRLFKEADKVHEELQTLKAEQASCHIRPGGFCQSWSALITLLAAVYPAVSINDLALDIWKYHSRLLPNMRELISRFSYNMFAQTYDAKRDKNRVHECCYNEDIVELGLGKRVKHYPGDICDDDDDDDTPTLLFVNGDENSVSSSSSTSTKSNPLILSYPESPKSTDTAPVLTGVLGGAVPAATPATSTTPSTSTTSTTSTTSATPAEPITPTTPTTPSAPSSSSSDEEEDTVLIISKLPNRAPHAIWTWSPLLEPHKWEIGRARDEDGKWPKSAQELDLSLLDLENDSHVPKQFRQWKECVDECLRATKHRRPLDTSICDLGDLAVVPIEKDDPRVALHGQHKVVATRDLPVGKCYPYGGLVKRSDESFKVFNKKDMADFKTLSYTFPDQIHTNDTNQYVDVLVSGYGIYGNAVSRINDCRENSSKCTEKDKRSINVIYCNPLVNGRPVCLAQIVKPIKKGQELLSYYGDDYFQNLKSKSTKRAREDVSTGDDDEANPTKSSKRQCLKPKAKAIKRFKRRDHVEGTIPFLEDDLKPFRSLHDKTTAKNMFNDIMDQIKEISALPQKTILEKAKIRDYYPYFFNVDNGIASPRLKFALRLLNGYLQEVIKNQNEAKELPASSTNAVILPPPIILPPPVTELALLIPANSSTLLASPGVDCAALPSLPSLRSLPSSTRTEAKETSEAYISFKANIAKQRDIMSQRHAKAASNIKQANEELIKWQTTLKMAADEQSRIAIHEQILVEREANFAILEARQQKEAELAAAAAKSMLLWSVSETSSSSSPLELPTSSSSSSVPNVL